MRSLPSEASVSAVHLPCGGCNDCPACFESMPERLLMRKILERLHDMPSALRQGVADREWADVALWVDESASSTNLAAGATLTVSPQNTGLELIESVVAIVPTGATGTVTLGTLVLPVPAGVTVLSPVRRLLGSQDTRSLTITGGSGGAALWLTGRQVPTYGVLR